jgi:cell division protein FtsB
MKRRRNRTKRGYAIVIMLFILAIPLFYLGRRVYRYTGAVLEEKKLARTKIVLRAENDMLKMRIDEYRKGVLVETRAREELRMIRKGEKIYMVKRK